MVTKSHLRRRTAIDVIVVLSILLVVGPLGISCSDDDPAKPSTKKTSPFEDLTERDDVLFNLERAYNSNNTGEIDKLLDDNFIFYFSAANYSTGQTPKWWSRSEEASTTNDMLDPAYAGAYKVLDIDLNLQFTEGEAAWIEVTPTDPAMFPGEKWYKKRAIYYLKVVVEAQPENMTYVAANILMEFKVRQADVGDKTVWRVVECRDDVVTAATADTPTGGQGLVQDDTWGSIKHIYYDGPVYEDLTNRDHVLNNLLLAYDEWNVTEFARLLNDDFVFFFSEADYGSGSTPEQWDRASELASASNMFDPNYSGRYKPISVRLAMDYPPLSWTEVVPGQDAYPGETWYAKTVIYSIIVVAQAEPEHITFIGYNIRAQFTVRQVEIEGEDVWQIVTWRDDVYGLLARASNSAKTEETSWGQIKALYGG